MSYDRSYDKSSFGRFGLMETASMDVSFESTEHPTMPVRAETMAVSTAVEDTTVSKVVTTVEATVSFLLCSSTHSVETNRNY